MKVRWRQIKRTRDLPPSEESVLVTIEKNGVLEVVYGWYTKENYCDRLDELSWNFLEWWPDHKAVAWCKLPEPFKQ